MTRRSRRTSDSGILNLDSLMDILSCLVGVMLFLVIYTVLELGSTTFQAFVPVVQTPPIGTERVVVVAADETVRVLDVREPLQELLGGIEIVGFADLPLFVRQANDLAPVDPYFQYSLSQENRFSAFGTLSGVLDMHVTAREGVVGDSIRRLDERSRYATLLQELDPERVWLTFAVDSASIDVFRRAREMATARGFATEWRPYDLEFPLTFAISELGRVDLLNPSNTVFKPQR